MLIEIHYSLAHMRSDIAKLILDTHELAPTSREQLGVKIMLQSIAAERISVVHFDKKRSPICRHAEVNPVASRRIPVFLHGALDSRRIEMEPPIAFVRAHI